MVPEIGPVRFQRLLEVFGEPEAVWGASERALGQAGLERRTDAGAVLGSGLDRAYPTEHAGLAGEIAARGAVLCEFPLGTT